MRPSSLATSPAATPGSRLAYQPATTTSIQPNATSANPQPDQVARSAGGSGGPHGLLGGAIAGVLDRDVSAGPEGSACQFKSQGRSSRDHYEKVDKRLQRPETWECVRHRHGRDALLWEARHCQGTWVPLQPVLGCSSASGPPVQAARRWRVKGALTR